MSIIELLHTGPVTRETATLQRQACLVHAETDDRNQVIAAAPGGVAAGWMVMPIWGSTNTIRDEYGLTILDEEDRPVVESYISSNPRINAKGEKMWLLVRNIEC